MENIIRLVDVTKVYEDEIILSKISFSIQKNEFFTLLGPSGCGKTTTLRLIAGFEQPSSGDVFFYNDKINHIPPYKRNVNTVFQKYSLFPHMNVYENIAFGLRIKNVSEADIRRKVSKTLELVNLPGFEGRSVTAMSGGQQQRIAIARAVANQPDVLLLDEPLGALDLKLRKEMQTELKNIQQTLGITFVYVTHDQEEALTMSDNIIVMNGGNIQQIGSPIDIYNEPSNAFVADFIGESNILDGIMPKDCEVEFSGRRFECVDSGFAHMQSVDVVVRPEDIRIVEAEEGMLRGVVTSVVFKGVHYEMMVKSGDCDYMVHSTAMEPCGKEVGMNIRPFDIHIMHKPEDSTQERIIETDMADSEYRVGQKGHEYEY